MYFHSTNGQAPKADFRTATLQGQAPDKGLYFPDSIPRLPESWLHQLPAYSKTEVALEVIRPYVGDAIPAAELERIVSETISFPFPLVPVSDKVWTLELFHGPTLAFKDVGARFMSRCLGYFVQHERKKVTVLVATSGDTGGAVADGFYGVDGIEVVVLYPSGKVSGIQELQLTTLGKNIKALEVSGTFDDCQHLVKQAFADDALRREVVLTSANSINVARWLPQQFYYFYALQQWRSDAPPVIAVPSGNFGNICAGLLAYRSGLPVRHFVAACNANDTVPEYFTRGTYQAKQAVPTLSNAMDVGDPNNFVRLLSLFEQEFGALKKMMTPYSITDEATRNTIRSVFQDHGYLLDPHGAVGYAALARYREQHPGSQGFFLETAHPVKFGEVVRPVIQQEVALPEQLHRITGKKKQSIPLRPDYADLRHFLLDHR